MIIYGVECSKDIEARIVDKEELKSLMPMLFPIVWPSEHPRQQATLASKPSDSEWGTKTFAILVDLADLTLVLASFSMVGTADKFLFLQLDLLQ